MTFLLFTAASRPARQGGPCGPVCASVCVPRPARSPARTAAERGVPARLRQGRSGWPSGALPCPGNPAGSRRGPATPRLLWLHPTPPARHVPPPRLSPSAPQSGLPASSRGRVRPPRLLTAGIPGVFFTAACGTKTASLASLLLKPRPFPTRSHLLFPTPSSTLSPPSMTLSPPGAAARGAQVVRAAGGRLLPRVTVTRPPAGCSGLSGVR